MTVTDGSRCDDDRLCSSLSPFLLFSYANPWQLHIVPFALLVQGVLVPTTFSSLAVSQPLSVPALLTFSFVLENVDKGTCSNCIHTHCGYINPALSPLLKVFCPFPVVDDHLGRYLIGVGQISVEGWA